MIGLRALAKSWKSSSGAWAPKTDDLSNGFRKKMIGWRALAKSWKSSSGAWAPKTDDFSKGFKRKTIGLRALVKLNFPVDAEKVVLMGGSRAYISSAMCCY